MIVHLEMTIRGGKADVADIPFADAAWFGPQLTRGRGEELFTRTLEEIRRRFG